MARPVACFGVGLHRGKPVEVELVAEAGPVRLECDGVARALDAFRVSGTRLSTSIVCDEFEVHTVEHFFSALAGLGIRDGLRVVIDGEEMPLLDGGASVWARHLRMLDLSTSARPATRIARDATITIDGSTYAFSTSDDVRIEVDVDLPPSCDRRAAWNGDAASYVEHIAPARTFALDAELDAIARERLARHVDPESVLVVTNDAIHGRTPVSRDEPARHKLLDLIGDAYLHGGPPRGTLHATRPGHARNHAAFSRARALGVIVSLGAAFAIALAPSRARADDSSRPSTLFDLTHKWPELMLDEMLASVTYNDAALQGTTYVRVERLAWEMPIAQSPWYIGAAYDAAIGHDDDGAPRLVSGNPEIWGRGVWTSTYGLSFGGGFSFIIPTKSYSAADASATTAFAAIAARGWDRALFDPDNATLRPFLDVRLVTGPITVQYRQALEIATDFGDTAFRFAAVGTVYFGVRFSKLFTAGADLIEYYRLDSGLDDDQRPYFAVGAHVAFDTPYFKPTLGVMTNIGSPLNAISRIGASFTAAPASFIGIHFSLDFPFRNVTIGKKKP